MRNCEPWQGRQIYSPRHKPWELGSDRDKPRQGRKRTAVQVSFVPPGLTLFRFHSHGSRRGLRVFRPCRGSWMSVHIPRLTRSAKSISPLTEAEGIADVPGLHPGLGLRRDRETDHEVS